MRTYLLLFCSLCLHSMARGQTNSIFSELPAPPELSVNRDLTGSGYRYWFDGNTATSVDGVVPGNTFHIDIPVTQLGDWFHTLFLQVRDTTGNWGEIVSRHFMIMPSVTIPSVNCDMTDGHYRYWFDGSTATARMGSLGGNVKALDVPVDSLGDWFHTLYMQVQDKDGIWSETVSRHFMIMPKLAQSVANRDMTEGHYRYWFDNNKTAAYMGELGGNVKVLDVPVDSLEDWFHTLYLQVQDMDGNWSETVSRHFMIMPKLTPTPANRDMTDGHYRYWFDGNKTTARMGELGENVKALDIPVDSLGDWFHTLHLQVQDTTGNWSETVSRHFMIMPQITDGLTRYEYWLNDNWSTREVVKLAENVDSLHVEEELEVTAQAIRSSAFHFTMEERQPVLHPVNDFHISFYNYWNHFDTGTASFIDENTTVPVTNVTALEPGKDQLTTVPSTNEIKWYSMYLLAGDSISLRSNRNCTLQLFSPTATEVYHAEDSLATVLAGCRVTDYGRYYLAVHDAPSSSTSRLLLDYELSDHTDPAGTPGDVNDDGHVNVADLVMTVNEILEEHPQGFNTIMADISHDGWIDVEDLVGILDIITAWPKNAPRRVHAFPQQPDGNLSGTLNGNLMRLALTGATHYSTFQLTMTLPKDARIEDVRLSDSRRFDQLLSWNQLDDGRLIVVVYSPNKHALKGTDGPLLEVQTQLDVTTPVMVRDIVFITQQGMVHRFSPFQLGDQDDNTTDINHFGTPVSTQWQEGQTYYDLTGRKVGNAELHRSKGLKKGIYIINNMKVAIQ